jgi:hypothetical protein
MAARRVAGRMNNQEGDKPNRFPAQFLAQKRIAGRGLVAFVKQKIERGENAIEPRGEVLALGNLKTDRFFLQTLPGAGELFLNRRLAAEKGACDFTGAESAKDLKRKHDLRIGRNRWMTANEHEPERVVPNLVLLAFANGRRGQRLVEVGNDGGFFRGRHSLMAERIFGQIHRYARDPGGGIRGHPSHRPSAQGAKQRLLRHVFDQGEIVHAEQSDERTVQATGLVAEEMFHQLHDGRGRLGRLRFALVRANTRERDHVRWRRKPRSDG